jgi:hypothetical protein
MRTVNIQEQYNKEIFERFLAVLDELKKRKQIRSRSTFFKASGRTVTFLNTPGDFCPKGLDIGDLTSKKLRDFEKFLRSERTIVRKNQFGRNVKTKEKPLSDFSIKAI